MADTYRGFYREIPVGIASKSQNPVVILIQPEGQIVVRVGNEAVCANDIMQAFTIAANWIAGCCTYRVPDTFK